MYQQYYQTVLLLLIKQQRQIHLNTWRKEFYLLFNCVANQEKAFKNLYFVNNIHGTKEWKETP